MNCSLRRDKTIGAANEISSDVHRQSNKIFSSFDDSERDDFSQQKRFG